MLISCSKTEAPSLDSEMSITAALTDFAIERRSSIFDNKLSIFRWMICKPLFLKTFHLFKNCNVPVGLDFSLYHLRVIITTEKKNLSFYI